VNPDDNSPSPASHAGLFDPLFSSASARDADSECGTRKHRKDRQHCMRASSKLLHTAIPGLDYVLNISASQHPSFAAEWTLSALPIPGMNEDVANIRKIRIRLLSVPATFSTAACWCGCAAFACRRLQMPAISSSRIRMPVSKGKKKKKGSAGFQPAQGALGSGLIVGHCGESTCGWQVELKL